MRDRVKGFDTSELDFTLTDSNFFPTISGPCVIGNPARPKGYSHIQDELGHGQWQKANHVKCNYLPGQIGYFPQHGLYCEAISRSDHLFTVGNVEDLSKAAFTAARGSDYETWVNHLYEQFTDEFPDQFSIANTLIEMKNGVKEWLPQISDLKERISSNFLKIKFGIQPFIKDLKDSCLVYGNFKKRLKFLQDTNKLEFRDRKKMTSEDSLIDGAVLNQYYVSYIKPPIPGPGPPLEFPGIEHQLQTRFIETDAQAMHFATAFISNQLTDLDNVTRQVDAMLGMCGINNLPKIVWNAIPWTWLGEWFVDMDNILEAFEVQPFEGKLVLNRAYLSSKIRVAGQIKTRCVDSEYVPLDVKPGEGLLRLYDRSARVEMSESFISPRLIPPNLSGSQSAILLALIDQRCRAVPDVAGLFRKWRGHK